MRTTIGNLKREKYGVICDRRSMFGNPYPITPYRSRDAAISEFREYFLHRVENDRVFREAVLALRGQHLLCWCHPKPCHLSVIVEWLDRQSDDP